MTVSAASTATDESAAPRPRSPEPRTVLHEAVATCVAMVRAGDQSVDASVAPRRACLAVVDAVLLHEGIEGICDDRIDTPLTETAAELIADSPSLDRIEAAAELASIFEKSVDQELRERQGTVYTPDKVVRFMFREALAARIGLDLGFGDEEVAAAARGDFDQLTPERRNQLARRLDHLRIVDPAVGMGAFLIGAARELAALASKLCALDVPITPNLLTPRGALDQCLRGFEVDPEATRVASAILALSCPGERVRTVPNVITTRNALLGGFHHADAKNGWDIVLMNPPYVGEKYLRRRLGDDLHSALKARDGFAGDLLAHFLVRAHEEVGSNGVISAIVSDTTFTMGSMATVRQQLLKEATLVSLAWCRPFKRVAARGGIVTLVRKEPDSEDSVMCYETKRAELDIARGKRVSLSCFTRLPGFPLFWPSDAALWITKNWCGIDELEWLAKTITGRPSRQELAQLARGLAPGKWTLLGAAVIAGQGLATGDDRRFVGYVAGSKEARHAVQRQCQLVEVLRTQANSKWSSLRHAIASGRPPDAVLLEVLESADPSLLAKLSGRKPFRIVDPSEVRRKPLTAEERQDGIAAGPTWVPYETGDRSEGGGGARWCRDNPVVIDWSDAAVNLLRLRAKDGPKKPVMRHEELWFTGGVTHNRVTSFLKARLLSEDAIFSSESPCYRSAAPWLSDIALLAILNSPVIEFILKTFLATRNHVEVGHVRQLPIPVLTGSQLIELEELGSAALEAASGDQAGELAEIEAALDFSTRRLYGVPKRSRLPIAR